MHIFKFSTTNLIPLCLQTVIRSLFRRVADESSLDTPVRQLALGLCRYSDIRFTFLSNISHLGKSSRYSVKAEGGETSATLQPFFTLQLDIQHEMVGSVEEALLQNFASEQLDGYICSKTRQEVEASRNLSLEDLPPILVLHLKRCLTISSPC